jgi:hypothetical protein
MKVKVNHWRLVPTYTLSRSHTAGVKEKPYTLVRKREVSDVNNLMACGGATQVRVYDDGGELLSEGLSLCHPHENFCRKSGREAALRYATYGMPSGYHPPVVEIAEIPEELRKFV